jgi:hypothetical protein
MQVFAQAIYHNRMVYGIHIEEPICFSWNTLSEVPMWLKHAQDVIR